MEYDIASVDYILETTRSVRKRLDLTRPVDPQEVMRCLEILRNELDLSMAFCGLRDIQQANRSIII